MKMHFSRILELIYYYALFILAALFIFLSARVYVADSEFWSISSGYHFFEDIDKQWVFTRPVFHFLLWLSQINYTLPTYSVYSARALMVLNAIVILYLMIKIQKQRTQFFIYGIISAVLLLGNTGFLNQGFRIRSDFMATTLSLIAIVIFRTPRPSSSERSWLILFAPLLATPKAVLQSIGLVCFHSFPNGRRRRIILGVCIFVVAGFALYLNRNNFVYLKHALAGHEGNPAFLSGPSFYHLENQIRRNPLFWILVLFRFVTRYFAKSRSVLESNDAYKDSAFQFLTVLTLISMFFYVEKTQFFIASLLPFLALHAAMIFYDLEILIAYRTKKLLLLLVFSITLLTGGYWFKFVDSEDRNDFQLQTLDSTYHFIKDRNIISFQDFNCFIPPMCQLRNFIGPNQPQANKDAMEQLAQARPELVYYIKKAGMLEPRLGEFLSSNYRNIGKGVFVLRGEDTLHNKTSQNANDKSLNAGSNLDSISKFSGLEMIIPGQLVHLFGYDIEY